MAKSGDSKITTELEKMNDLTKKVLEIRQAEFRQDIYLGAELKKSFPGIKLETKTFLKWWTPSQEFWSVVDIPATLKNPDNKANMPKALGLKNGADWTKSAKAVIDNYGAQPPPGKKWDPAFGHYRMLQAFENWKNAVQLPVCKP
jgi:hypothetical protein